MRLVCIANVATAGDGAPWVNTLDGSQVAAVTPWVALERLKSSHFDAVIARLPLEDWSAEDLLEHIQRAQASVPVILCDPAGTVADAVRLTKLGAFHFTTGEDPEQFRQILEWAADYSRSRDLAMLGDGVSEEPWRKFLVGESRAMQHVMQVIRLVGSRRSTVLISGETGAGKEMVARAIHMAGDRRHLAMVAVNSTALPENLLEAELFGHVKGAFTGAINQRIGRFEQAHRSTLFLDEVGDLPLDVQAKLLRVLQEREFQRIGSSETIKVDVRLIAATNQDLEQAVDDGKFREDLYYRLNVVPLRVPPLRVPPLRVPPLRVPPLRERLSDIPLLVHHLIDKICRQEGLPLRRIARETLERLSSYSWPGNVRQLENAVEMAIALSGERDTLFPADFPLPPSPHLRSGAAALPTIAFPDEGLDFEQIVAHMERTILEQALQKTGGNKAQAAGMLRLKRTTLAAKLKSLAALARSA